MEPIDELPYGSQAAELRDYWRTVRAHLWLVLLCVTVMPAGSLIVSLRTTPTYEATATVVRQGASLGEAFFGAQVYEYRDPKRELETAAGSVTVAEVAQVAKRELDSAATADELAAMVTAEPSPDADMLRISARGGDPREAADVANAFAEGFVAVELEKKKANVALARRVVEGQLNDMTALELQSPRGLTLAERAETLGIIEQLQIGDYSVSRPAGVPTTPVSPQPVRNGLVAVAVGLVFGVGLSFLLEYMDRRLKTEEAIEREFGLPVLARVPVIGRQWRDGGDRSRLPVGFRDSGSTSIESYRTLRSNLRYFEVDGRVRTLLVTSAMPGEGKTITTINLALSLAMAGSRVVVLDADLRRPTLHAYLGLANGAGLSNILAGGRGLDEVMQTVRLDDFVLLPNGTQPARRRSVPDPPSQFGDIRCVTSGPLPPNPTELLGSSRMREILAMAADKTDYVLVDSPPLLSVADALPIAGVVDGVLIAARMYRTTVDEARQVRTLLARAGREVNPIGVVVGGVKVARRRYYRYGYYDRGQRRSEGRVPGTERTGVDWGFGGNGDARPQSMADRVGDRP